MYSVFSDSKKPTDQIRALRKCAGWNLTRELLAGPEDEPLCMLSPKVINVLAWINDRILFELPNVKKTADKQWVDVRIRIATSKLNNCVKCGALSNDMSITYHQRLVKRVRDILKNIYVEDLPF